MKHLLSKLTLLGIVSLIVVSCSKSPEQYVENCADNYFVSLLNDKIDKNYINKPKDEITWICLGKYTMVDGVMTGTSHYNCPYYSDDGTLDIYNNVRNCSCNNIESVMKNAKKELSEYKVLLAELKDMTLQEKLTGFPSPWRSYESEFSYCASSMKTDEVTFKAKWK